MSDIKVIIDELSRTLSGIDRKQQEQMADEILKAKHIFVAGAGRSGMMARCFAMRLMHMGMKAYMVGEVVTPSMPGRRSTNHHQWIRNHWFSCENGREGQSAERKSWIDYHLSGVHHWKDGRCGGAD